MKATQQLKDEHEGINLMLSIMEKIFKDVGNGNFLNIDHYEKIIDFLQDFVDKCHNSKEEDILFPAMINYGVSNEWGLIAVLKDEHELSRCLLKSLRSAFEEFKEGNNLAINIIMSSSLRYIALLRTHTEKENIILFMMADKVINETEQSKIFDDFENLEIEKIGIGKHEEYHDLLKELKQIYL